MRRSKRRKFRRRFRKRFRRKYKRGVPKGYRHHWDYKDARWHENKVKPGVWKITFMATKGRRGKKAKFHPGAPPIGTRIRWKVTGIQRAIKISRNKYKTKMIGTKRLLKIKRPRRY